MHRYAGFLDDGNRSVAPVVVDGKTFVIFIWLAIRFAGPSSLSTKESRCYG